MPASRTALDHRPVHAEGRPAIRKSDRNSSLQSRVDDGPTNTSLSSSPGPARCSLGTLCSYPMVPALFNKTYSQLGASRAISSAQPLLADGPGRIPTVRCSIFRLSPRATKGSFPRWLVSTMCLPRPVTQESVLTYGAGIKPVAGPPLSLTSRLPFRLQGQHVSSRS